MENILQIIKKNSIRLLSLDIFDTLVFRMVDHPHQIFYEIGKKAIKSNLLHPSITAEDFALLRIKAEQDARIVNLDRNSNNEVNLEEINEFLPQFIGHRTELQSLELKTECEFCYLNPEILKLIEDFKSQGLPVALTSDMYLNKEQLKQILKSNGFDLNLIKEIYVSCEHGGDKSSGVLFRKLQSDLPHISPEKILHIGDKLEADFHSPRLLGIQAHHYSTIPEELNKIYEHEKICQTAPSILNSLRSLGVHSTGNPDSIENQLGAGILGPVFTEFCEWVLDLCEEENIKQVFPLMREAELFHPMLENAAKKRSLEIKIESLYASRESTWLASLKEWGEEELDDLLEKHCISVSEIFQTLGIALPKSFDLEYQEKNASDLNLKQREIFKEYLLSDSVVESVNQEIASRCSSLIEYLKQKVDFSQKSVTVDLGFRGTINSNMEKAMAKEHVDSKLTHLLAFGSDSIIELKKIGINIRSFLASPSINQDYLKVIQRSSFLIESLILGRTGSTKGYKKIDGKHSPVLHDQFLEKNEIESKAKIFDAIMAYQNLWQKVASEKPDILRKAYSNPSFTRELCGLIYSMIDLPTSRITQFLAELRHELNDGTKEITKLCSNKDFQSIEEIGSEEKFLKVSRINNVHWPQGVISANSPYFLIKRKLEQNASDSYLNTMNDLSQTLKAKGISSIIIYGAGDAGKSMLTAATINNIYVECFVDRKESLWGKYIENTMIYSLVGALQKFGPIPVVIGSFQFLKQIEDSINLTCEKLSLHIEVFSIKDF
jgi:predicted HAD superfamily hydrolase